MEKLRMQTLDGVQSNISKIAELFPECITEVKWGLKIPPPIVKIS